MINFFSNKSVYFKFINKCVSNDFYVTVAGYEKMLSSQRQKGPYFKNCFCLHYCIEGEGSFTINKRSFKISAGDVFLIPPKEMVSYKQSDNNPWTYIWFEFCGKSAYEVIKRTKLTIDNPCYRPVSSEYASSLISIISSLEDVNEDLVCIGNLYLFLAQIIKERKSSIDDVPSKKNNILDDIIQYIDDNYSKSYITLSQISEYFHINKSYLTRIFKKKTKLTVTKYILQTRINKACELLKTKQLSIKAVAYSVGFNDSMYFSKCFKEVMHFSPTEFYSIHTN